MDKHPEYERHVFINCPFDDKYKPLFNAVIFVFLECGLTPRSALELTDSGKVRIHKILDLITQCKFGIHDLWRTELDIKNHPPRINMPLELDLFLGAMYFGNQKQKSCLIFV